MNARKSQNRPNRKKCSENAVKKVPPLFSKDCPLKGVTHIYFLKIPAPEGLTGKIHISPCLCPPRAVPGLDTPPGFSQQVPATPPKTRSPSGRLTAAVFSTSPGTVPKIRPFGPRSRTPRANAGNRGPFNLQGRKKFAFLCFKNAKNPPAAVGRQGEATRRRQNLLAFAGGHDIMVSETE